VDNLQTVFGSIPDGVNPNSSILKQSKANISFDEKTKVRENS